MNAVSQGSTLNDYVLVTAAYNEEKYIERTIQSVVSQTVLPRKWVIVSDGSTDRTDEIVLHYAQRYPFIVLSRVAEGHARNFAAQVLAINAGCTLLTELQFDCIGNLDADVSFEPTYYQSLLERFVADADLGLAGGFIYEEDKGIFRSRPSNSTASVPHAVQFFRRACFDSIGPYRPLKYGGPDWFAEVRARQLGWKVAAFPDLPVHHFRPTNGAEGLLRGRLRQGRMDYSIGSLFFFEILKCLRRVPESPRLLGAIVRFYGYLGLYLSRAPLLVPNEFVQYLRQEQHQRLRAPLRRLRSWFPQRSTWLKSAVTAASAPTATSNSDFVAGVQRLDEKSRKQPE